jgi:hypothetical protein
MYRRMFSWVTAQVYAIDMHLSSTDWDDDYGYGLHIDIIVRQDRPTKHHFHVHEVVSDWEVMVIQVAQGHAQLVATDLHLRRHVAHVMVLVMKVIGVPWARQVHTLTHVHQVRQALVDPAVKVIVNAP